MKTQNTNTTHTMKEEPTQADRENFFGGVIYAYTRCKPSPTACRWT